MRSVSESGSTSVNHPPSLRLLDFSLRLSVIPLNVVSIWFTVTNQEVNDSYGKLEFRNLLGLKYMVFISVLSAVYTLFAAASSWIRVLVTRTWLFFVSDQVVAYLMVTSGAAVSEILYLAYSGNKQISWSEACSSFGKFCSRMKLALVLHILSLCCCLVVAVVSAYRVFSMYEPPLLPPKEGEEAKK